MVLGMYCTRQSPDRGVEPREEERGRALLGRGGPSREQRGRRNSFRRQ